MWIRKTKIEEHYRNANNDMAVIEMFPDDSVVLTIRDSNFQQTFQKTYSSRKGARVALGRFGKWKFVIATEHLKTSKTKGGLYRDR